MFQPSPLLEPSLSSTPGYNAMSWASLPTAFGLFRIYAFAGIDGKEHVALVKGEVAGAEHVTTRVHSECLTGDVFASQRCDCREQLEQAQRTLGGLPRGILVYLRQEGRGIGLVNKIAAYALQEKGLDTVDANEALGFQDDERHYGIAADILRALKVRSIALMTNNPKKVAELAELGVSISARLPLAILPGAHNRDYLRTKAQRSGHLLDLDTLQARDRAALV